MAQVWQCDRCEVVSRGGNIDDPTDGWERRSMPVRGSQGARSSNEVTLCIGCDDELYAWLHRREQQNPGPDKLKVAVCEYLLGVNEQDPDHPFIPPTAIDWLGNGIVSAVLDVA